MGIPGYGSPYIRYQQPFASYAPQRGVPQYGQTNLTGFPPIQSQGDFFSPTSSALDFSSSNFFSPTGFTGMPDLNTGNPFMTSFSPQSRGLTTIQGFDNEIDVFGIGNGTTTTGANTATTETTGTKTTKGGDDGTVDVFGNGTTKEEGTGDDTTTEEGEETEGKEGKKKKNKMTMGQFLNLTLYCRRPNGSIDWAAFAAKYQTDEKPVKVTPLEPQTFGNYDET